MSGLSGGFGNLEELFNVGKTIYQALNPSRLSLFLKDTPDPGSDFGIAGAVAIDVANHDVETIVGDAARVTVPPDQSDRTT